MKNLNDFKKKYGRILRWTNGGSSDGLAWDYHFYIENLITGERTEIENTEALDFIKKTTLVPFRKTNHEGYDAHVELFNILGIQPLHTFDDLMTQKNISGNKLSIQSGVAPMTISDLRNGKTKFNKCTVDTALKIAKALDMTIEEIYNELSK